MLVQRRLVDHNLITTNINITKNDTTGQSISVRRLTMKFLFTNTENLSPTATLNLNKATGERSCAISTLTPFTMNSTRRLKHSRLKSTAVHSDSTYSLKRKTPLKVAI